MTTPMTPEQAAAFLDPYFDQLKLAVANRDGDAAMAVIKAIHGAGYPQVADIILDGMLDVGLRRLAERINKPLTATAVYELIRSAGTAGQRFVDILEWAVLTYGSCDPDSIERWLDAGITDGTITTFTYPGTDIHRYLHADTFTGLPEGGQ